MGTNNVSTVNISVIVCTYNRQYILPICLQSLVDQTIGRGLYEVIVVNNHSTDGTQNIAESFVEKYENFRVVFEKKQGLSQARNRGWKEAQGNYIAYIDDDAIAYPDWISSIVDFIERHPNAGVFGGPYDAFYLVSKPDWFPPEYGSLHLGKQERCIKLGSEWITGSNMVIRKELFYKYGGFDVTLGMIGCKAAYGEEVNFFLSMHDKGSRIFYVPSIRVAHLVAEYKMSLSWLLLSGFSAGRGYELTFNVNRSLRSHLVSFVKELGMAMYVMVRPVRIPFQRRLYYSLYRLYYEAGAVVEHISEKRS